MVLHQHRNLFRVIFNFQVISKEIHISFILPLLHLNICFPLKKFSDIFSSVIKPSVRHKIHIDLMLDLLGSL
jgi:hypothetical protein